MTGGSPVADTGSDEQPAPRGFRVASVAGVAGVVEALERVLGPLAEAAAQASGFSRRRSKLGGATFVRALARPTRT